MMKNDGKTAVYVKMLIAADVAEANYQAGKGSYEYFEELELDVANYAYENEDEIDFNAAFEIKKAIMG